MTARLVGTGHRIDDGVEIGYPPDRAIEQDLSLGPDARLRRGTVIYDGSRIGARFSTGHNVVVRESNQIGEDVSIWSNSVIDYGCVLGSRVKVHSNCYVAQFSVLEDDVFLAPGASLANDLYPGDETSAAQMQGPLIRRGAQLGVNVTVLPYVEIGAGAIIGAGAVVTRDVPPRAIVRGQPARVTGEVPASASIEQLLEQRREQGRPTG